MNEILTRDPHPGRCLNYRARRGRCLDYEAVEHVCTFEQPLPPPAIMAGASVSSDFYTAQPVPWVRPGTEITCDDVCWCGASPTEAHSPDCAEGH